MNSLFSSMNNRAEKVKQFKVLANANRLMILSELKQGKQSVNFLAKATKLSQQTVSNHLIRMRRDGVLRAKQEGLYMFYEIKDPFVKEIMQLL